LHSLAARELVTHLFASWSQAA